MGTPSHTETGLKLREDYVEKPNYLPSPPFLPLPPARETGEVRGSVPREFSQRFRPDNLQGPVEPFQVLACLWLGSGSGRRKIMGLPLTRRSLSLSVF